MHLSGEGCEQAEKQFSFLSNLLNAVSQAVIATDLNGKIIYWNRSARSLYGWSAQEATGLHIAQVIGMWISLNARAVRDARGEIIYYESMIQDITDRKQIEQQLQLQAAALESAANGIVIADRDGRIKWVNPAFTTLTGYTPEEVIGENPRILKSNHHDQAFYENLWGTVLAGKVWRGRIVNRRKDGTLYTEEMTITPVRGHSGEIVNFIAIKQDITEQKRLEDQLYQSQKLEAVGRLAGGVAHDFNNLLTAIIGYSQLMLSRLDRSSPLRQNVEEIDKAGRRAASLTSQLLAFSRKQVLQPKVIDINSVIADMERMLRRLIGEDIDVVTILRPEVSRVKADPGQIEQVVMNLAVNARDAMPKGGNLTIETANVMLDDNYTQRHPVKPGHYVMIAISDNGCGIDEETLSHIFEPFFTTKEQGKGTGLGLSMVYGIVKQSGGYIWAYSEVNRGTVFKVYLPAVSGETGGQVSSIERESLPQGTETILLVEDEASVRELAARVLRERGYTVIEAADGFEGLEIGRENLDKINLVLTDVVTPRMGGTQMAEQLTALRSDLKVLYMSGYTDNAIVQHCALDESVEFLQKPFTPDRLVRKVREVIDKG